MTSRARYVLKIGIDREENGYLEFLQLIVKGSAKLMAEALNIPRQRVLVVEKYGGPSDSQSSPNKVIGPMAPIRRGPLRVDQYGEASYKNTPSETLKKSIQLGLQVSIGALEPKPKRDLLMTDFEVEELVNFPSDGSSDAPAHNYSSFKFKTYSPVAFRFFRDAFGINPQDFMLALCDKPLVDLSNPGASGSLFYLSTNDEFIMKTVQRKEAEFLQKLLPGYYLNLTQNRYTLLPKFFGLYKYQCGGTNIRIVTMNNLLPRSYVFHEKFDLKGSTFKRKASPEEIEKKSPTFKDLDFAEMHPKGFTLSPEHYDAVNNSLSRDVKVLESFSIMDYSLLFAIHYLEKAEPPAALTQSLDIAASPDQDNFDEARRRRATFSILSRDKRPNVRKRTVEEVEFDQNESAVGSTDVGIPAVASDGRSCLLFAGIIDILQSYRLKKKLEHGIKSIFTDGSTISVCHPHDYAQRFLNFMTTQVFKKGEKPKAKAKRHSMKGKRTASFGATAERILLRQESTKHNSVPPSYNDILESDKNNKKAALESSSDNLGSDTDPSFISPERNSLGVGREGETAHNESMQSTVSGTSNSGPLPVLLLDTTTPESSLASEQTSVKDVDSTTTQPITTATESSESENQPTDVEIQESSTGTIQPPLSNTTESPVGNGHFAAQNGEESEHSVQKENNPAEESMSHQPSPNVPRSEVETESSNKSKITSQLEPSPAVEQLEEDQESSEQMVGEPLKATRPPGDGLSQPSEESESQMGNLLPPSTSSNTDVADSKSNQSAEETEQKLATEGDLDLLNASV